LLVKYVEDRDIWTKLLSNTDAFAAWFHTLPFEYETYKQYLDEKLLLEMIEEKGIPFKELNDYYIKQAVEHCVVKFCEINGKLYFVAIVNFTVCKSDVGNQIFDKYPLCDFSAIYNINDNNDSTSFSLRSIDVNVGDIAFSLGGGGHAPSSACKVRDITNHLPGEVLDKGKLYHQIHKIYFDILSINEITYNIVYFSWSLYKTRLASYFLQTKYIEKSSKTPIKVWKDIAMKREKPYPENVQMAIVLNYNPAEDITEFSIVVDKLLTEQQKNDIDKWFGHDVNEGLKCKGAHRTVPVDHSFFII
jgi:hypothetical protein